MSQAPIDVASLTGLRGVAARRPIATLLTLILLIVWPALWIIPLSARGVLPWGDVSMLMLTILVFVMLGLTMWVTWAGEGMDGVRQLLSRMFRWRFSAAHWVLILFGLPVLGLIISVAAGGTLDPGKIGPVLLKEVGSLLFAIFVVNLWEETVWMGFVQTRIERRFKLFTAAAITAVPFVFVHIPAMFAPPGTTVGMVAGNVVGLLVFALIFRPMLALGVRGTGDSVLAAGLLHAVFNRVSLPDGLLKTLTPNVDPLIGTFSAMLIVTVLLWLMSRGKQSRAYRLDVLEAGAAR